MYKIDKYDKEKEYPLRRIQRNLILGKGIFDISMNIDNEEEAFLTLHTIVNLGTLIILKNDREIKKLNNFFDLIELSDIVRSMKNSQRILGSM